MQTLLQGGKRTSRLTDHSCFSAHSLHFYSAYFLCGFLAHSVRGETLYTRTDVSFELSGRQLGFEHLVDLFERAIYSPRQRAGADTILWMRVLPRVSGM